MSQAKLGFFNLINASKLSPITEHCLQEAPIWIALTCPGFVDNGIPAIKCW